VAPLASSWWLLASLAVAERLLVEFRRHYFRNCGPAVKTAGPFV
jgi:hypothetical protein